MLPKPLLAVWGDLSTEEAKKFGMLSTVFFLVLGIYWMLKTMKDPIFDLHVGYRYQPWAKAASLIFVGLTILFYSKLLDIFEKQAVFTIMCCFYGLSFMVLAYCLANPSCVHADILSAVPGSIFGWMAYLFVESFGSIMPALLWAFVASVTTAKSAQRGYGMLATCTNLGTMLGPLFISIWGARLGLPCFFCVAGLLTLIVPFLIRWCIRSISITSTASVFGPKQRANFTDGLRLLVTTPYLLGIFAVTTLYEFIGTILDFQKGMLISQNYPTRLDGGAAFAWFKGLEGTAIGIVSFMFALFGTSFFMRRLGLRFSLISFPVVIGVTIAIVCGMYYAGTDSYSLMWTFFYAVVLIKGLNYALNNPTKEVLYIPTSNEVKFKTKGWIDAFGARFMKALGAGVNESLSRSLPLLLSIGALLSLGVIGVWIFAAFFVSGSFSKLQQDNGPDVPGTGQPV